MAASMKRHHGNEDVPNKKIALSDISVEKLHNFLEWCSENKFSLTNKVKISKEGSCAQYGMVAVEDIADGYCLFQVPRSALLKPSNCAIADLIEKDQLKLSTENQWVPLLISLLYEENNTDSKWRPYLDLFPDFEALDLPLFWDISEVERLLKGTGVDLAVARDLKMIEKDYNNIVIPFLQKHAKFSQLPNKDFEFFKKMVAFVMAYSFTEPKDETPKAGSDDDDDEHMGTSFSPPMMVPMADILNHVTSNNAKLTYGKEALKMVTTSPIKKGEEIFNTYGFVSNLHLMHMYGFSEPYPDNTCDVVEIPVTRLLAAAKDSFEDDDRFDKTLLDQKWKFLLDAEIFTEDDIFVIGTRGIVTDDICLETLKVLSMSRAEFKDHMGKDGWSDASSDCSASVESELDFENFSKFDSRWKIMLRRMGELHLEGYATSLEADEKLLKSSSKLPPRERYALYLAHGQKMLIKSLILYCTDSTNT